MLKKDLITLVVIAVFVVLSRTIHHLPKLN
jgi:hypothetical protein